MDLTKYKNIFGKPNEGFHSIRIFNIAILDVIGTLLFALLFSFIIYKNLFFRNVLNVFLILFIIAEIFHYIFGVQTTVIKYFFNN